MRNIKNIYMMDHEKKLIISMTIIVSVLMIVGFNLWRTNENS